MAEMSGKRSDSASSAVTARDGSAQAPTSPPVLCTSPPPSSTPAFLSWLPASWTEQLDKFNDAQRLERLEQCRQLEEALSSCRQKQEKLYLEFLSKSKDDAKPATPSASRWSLFNVRSGEAKTAQSRSQQQQQEQGDSDPTRERNLDGTDRIHDEIESTVPGLRMMKYFGWRGAINPIPYGKPKPTASTEDSEETQPKRRSPEEIMMERREKLRSLNSTCAREQHAMWGCRAVAMACGNELSQLKNCFDETGAEKMLACPINNYEQKKARSGEAKDEGRALSDRIPCAELQRALGSCVNKNAQALYEREHARSRQK